MQSARAQRILCCLSVATAGAAAVVALTKWRARRKSPKSSSTVLPSSVYCPPHFRETREEVLHAVMREYPLAMLVVSRGGGHGGPIINHIPLYLDPTAGPHGTLRGHVARSNPVWRRFRNEETEPIGGLVEEITAVFRGPDEYVSPSYYPSKAEHGKVVPTWNYAVVHAHGVPRAIHDPEWILNMLTELTDRHESEREAPWRVSDAPDEFVRKSAAGVVGIEIPLTRIEGKVKMSQNQPEENRNGVVTGFVACGNAAAADFVSGKCPGHSDSEPAATKVPKESNTEGGPPTEAQLCKIAKEQDTLATMSISDLKKQLRANRQLFTGTKVELVERCAQGKVLGAIPSCPSCLGGRPRYDIKTGIYKCPGYMDNDTFIPCSFTAGTMVRFKWMAA